MLLNLGLWGCASSKPVPDEQPAFLPTIPQPVKAPEPQNGSLFSDQSARYLYSDTRARRVGDILTVILQERTTSSKSANVSSAKNSQVGLSAGPVLGGPFRIGDVTAETQLQGDRQFNGEAAAGQQNRLEGDITVTVAEVYANGNLRVQGEKWLTLNRGKEYVRLSGLVRADDIAANNTVLSHRIANARIAYSGTGSLTNSQRMGLLSRFFNSPWWIF